MIEEKSSRANNLNDEPCRWCGWTPPFDGPADFACSPPEAHGRILSHQERATHRTNHLLAHLLETSGLRKEEDDGN